MKQLPSHYSAASSRRRLLPLLLAASAFGAFAQAQTTPPDTSTPVAIVAASGNSQAFTTFTATGGNATSTYQWRLNGTALAGQTAATLNVTDVQPQNTGFYSVDVLDVVGDTTTTRSASTVLGLSTTAKIVGSAVEVGTDIQHPNGNVYDQVLLNGPAATIKADAGQVTRVSFLDVNDDIVQVEFSGAGSASIALEWAAAPAAPAKYNQPDVQYVKGHPTITITGANETTHLAIFSVGTMNAVNQSLFKGSTIYDGHANVAAVIVQSTDGKFGGIRAGNTSFLAGKSYTGIYAPDVTFTAPLVLGEITAAGTATPVILLGGSTEVHIAGGELLQLNGAPVQISGFSNLSLDAGMSSHGVGLPAKALAGTLQDVSQRAN